MVLPVQSSVAAHDHQGRGDEIAVHGQQKECATSPLFTGQNALLFGNEKF
jgi:hypothetical protein